MQVSITPNTTANSAAIAPTKISASRASTVNAMTIAPNTTNGERSSSRSVRLSPVCTWFISLVMRVSSDDVPRASRSA